MLKPEQELAGSTGTAVNAKEQEPGPGTAVYVKEQEPGPVSAASAKEQEPGPGIAQDEAAAAAAEVVEEAKQVSERSG